MGTVFNRGSKEKPNWYVGYRESDGAWKYIPSRQPIKAQAKRFVQEIEGRIARGLVGIEEPASAPLCGALIEQFLEGLTNRNATDDRSRGRRHLLPKFGGMRIAEVTLATVMERIDEQRAAGELSDASIRHNMNLLSRFFSWAIARGKATINPVRQIPMGSRPTQTVKSDTPRGASTDRALDLRAMLGAVRSRA
jgi:integrase